MPKKSSSIEHPEMKKTDAKPDKKSKKMPNKAACPDEKKDSLKMKDDIVIDKPVDQKKPKYSLFKMVIVLIMFVVGGAYFFRHNVVDLAHKVIEKVVGSVDEKSNEESNKKEENTKEKDAQNEGAQEQEIVEAKDDNSAQEQEIIGVKDGDEPVIEKNTTDIPAVTTEQRDLVALHDKVSHLEKDIEALREEIKALRDAQAAHDAHDAGNNSDVDTEDADAAGSKKPHYLLLPRELKHVYKVQMAHALHLLDSGQKVMPHLNTLFDNAAMAFQHVDEYEKTDHLMSLARVIHYLSDIDQQAEASKDKTIWETFESYSMGLIEVENHDLSDQNLLSLLNHKRADQALPLLIKRLEKIDHEAIDQIIRFLKARYAIIKAQ